jgi:hypothetical protein
MLNQQDCLRLQQQARYFEASWQSTLPPAKVWPLCHARNQLNRQLGLNESPIPAEQKGVVKLSSGLVPGDWQELPAEWLAPQWWRCERYSNKRTYLAWEYRLEPTDGGCTLGLRLYFVLPSLQQGKLEGYFKRFCQVLGEALKALKSPSALSSPGWLAFIQQHSGPLALAAQSQLNQKGSLDPVLLAAQAGCSLAQSYAFCQQAEPALKPLWQQLEPDGSPGSEANWQSSPPLSLSHFGLRFVLSDALKSLHERKDINELDGRCLLWPGQSREWTISSSQSWVLGDGSQAGRVLLSPQAPELAEVNLASPVSRLLSRGRLRLSNPGEQLQMICLQDLSAVQGKALNLLSSSAAKADLLAVWPQAMSSPFNGLILKASAPIPQALLQGLEQSFSQADGACLSDTLFCFSELAAALACAQNLLQQLRSAAAWGLLRLPLPGLALASGSGSLCHSQQTLQLEGPLKQKLNHLLSLSRGGDLLLPARLLQAPKTQAWLGPHWHLIECEAGQSFQLRPKQLAKIENL